jgi:hypothetical protein
MPFATQCCFKKGPEFSGPSYQETLLVSVIRCIIVGVRFRRDILIAFRNATVDGIELFVIHRLSNALQTHHVFIFRSTDEDNALGVTPYHADFRHAVRTSVPASVIIMIWSVSSTCTAPTTEPLRSVTLMEITPCVPRDLVGYSLSAVRLP